VDANDLVGTPAVARSMERLTAANFAASTLLMTNDSKA
jgi:hypothetical protein